MRTSVAMCTYNGQNYIEEQLRSILEQSIPIDEIVICDDGSIDDTFSIIGRFIESGAPIRLIQNSKTLGYTRNFEKAICLCSGDIIFLADQDDIWMSNKVEVICDFFYRHSDREFLFTNALLINFMGTSSYDKTLFDVVGMSRRNKHLFDEGYPYDVLGVSGKVTGATIAFKASFLPYFLPMQDLGKMAIHDGMMSVSAVIWDKIAYIDQCLIKYRIHHNQSVGLGMLFKYPTRRYETANNILTWHLARVDKYHPTDANKLLVFYKRFLALRTSFSFFQLLKLYMQGEYTIYGTKKWNVLFRDMKGIGVRFVYKIKRMRNLHLIDKREL